MTETAFAIDTVSRSHKLKEAVYELRDGGDLGTAQKHLTNEYASVYDDIVTAGLPQAASNFKAYVDAMFAGKGEQYDAFLRALGL